jgi:hypothetical protein
MPKTRPKPKSADTKESAGLFKSLFSVAKTLGLDKNAAAISANTAVRKVMNVDVLALMDHTHLVSEDQHLYFTPTELGKRIGVSAQRFNQLLFDAGLQGSREGKWVPIESEAAGLYRVLDTGKRHSGGAMIQQIKWSDAVLSRLPSQEKVIPFPDGGVMA